MKNKSEILSHIGKDPGFKVPDNYFNDFADKMTKSLPEKEFKPELAPSLWGKIRPWAYMAAMFVGIWCMMKVFTSITDSSTNSPFNTTIAEAFKNEAFVEDYVISRNFDEYDLMQEMYEDSITPASEPIIESKY